MAFRNKFKAPSDRYTDTFADGHKATYRHLNELIDDIETVIPTPGTLKADTIAEYTSGSGVTVDGVLLKDSGLTLGSTGVTEYTKEVTIGATQIVGTAAEDIAHTDGATLVAAPGAGYALEFVSAVLIYDYLTAAYTGGNNDMTIRVGTVAQTSAVSKANCLGASGDKVYRIGCTATELSLPVNSAINLFAGTAFTQPGTAAGSLRVQLVYRVHTTGL